MDEMQVIDQAIAEVKLLVPKRFDSDLGSFSETYNRQTFASAGIDVEFVQDNISSSNTIGVLRGLHYQRPPFAQVKIVRVLRGRIFDVAVDIRPQSETFGRHVALELDGRDGGQLFIPAGFAHGFVTLEAETEVFYKMSGFYAPEHEGGLRWNDPDLGISWPLDKIGGEENVILSEKDRVLPGFRATFATRGISGKGTDR